jgi:hypothetical protein
VRLDGVRHGAARLVGRGQMDWGRWGEVGWRCGRRTRISDGGGEVGRLGRATVRREGFSDHGYIKIYVDICIHIYIYIFIYVYIYICIFI